MISIMMNDFYNDVLDAYLEGKLEQKDFDRIMKEVSNKTTKEVTK